MFLRKYTIHLTREQHGLNCKGPLLGGFSSVVNTPVLHDPWLGRICGCGTEDTAELCIRMADYKLHTVFQLCGASAPLTFALFKGQLYMFPLGCVWCLMDTNLHAISGVPTTPIMNPVLKTLDWKTGLCTRCCLSLITVCLFQQLCWRHDQNIASVYCPRESSAWRKCRFSSSWTPWWTL